MTTSDLTPPFPDAPSGLVFTSTSLEVTDTGLAVERFVEIFRRVSSFGDAARWWIGDLLVFGNRRYGEDYAQILDDLGVTYRQAERYRYVSQQVRPPRRRENLSFTHHEEVAPLDPAEQTRLLTRAIDEVAGAALLREWVRDLRALNGAPPRSTISPTSTIVDAVASVDAARSLSTVRATLRTVASALDPAGQEAVGIPAALRAVEEVGKTVKRATEQLARPPLLDVARRLVGAGVKQRALPDPAYIVPAAVFEELAERVAEET